MSRSSFDTGIWIELQDVTRGAALKRVLAFAVAVALVAIVAVGVLWQSRLFLHHDVAWIVRSAGWLLDGKRFGSDIIDVNPPLIWFLSVPAAALSRTGWIGEVDAVRAYFWLICIASLLLCCAALQPLRRAGDSIQSHAILLALAIAFCWLPLDTFGQREYLALLLGAPYCLLVAGRAISAVSPQTILASVIGCIAGIAFALKPWLLAVPLAIELTYLTRTRDLRKTFRPETWALAGTILAYLASVALITPDYFTVTIPFAHDVYWLFGRKTAGAMWESWRGVAGLFATASIFFLLARAFPFHARMLVAALAGFSFNYWIQRKGFTYHLYPVAALTFVIFVYACVAASQRLLRRWPTPWSMRFALAAGLAVLTIGVFQVTQMVATSHGWVRDNDQMTGTATAARRRLIERLEGLTEHEAKRIFVFSSVPYPGYPTMNYLAAVPTNSQLCLFAYSAYFKREALESGPMRAAADRGIATQRAIALRDFLAQPPDIVLVNNALAANAGRPFDFVEQFISDAAFAAEWRNYREIDPEGRVRIYVRRTDAT